MVFKALHHDACILCNYPTYNLYPVLKYFRSGRHMFSALATYGGRLVLGIVLELFFI